MIHLSKYEAKTASKKERIDFTVRHDTPGRDGTTIEVDVVLERATDPLEQWAHRSGNVPWNLSFTLYPKQVADKEEMQKELARILSRVVEGLNEGFAKSPV